MDSSFLPPSGLHQHPRIAIIGGGASGSFAAIQIKKLLPQAEVHLIERTNTLLAKVRISGGGRCNLTHSCFDPKILSTHYPRGANFLLPLFSQFQPKDTIEWFEREGVHLKKEEDGRMFPETDSSETIIQLFFSLFQKLGIKIHKEIRIQGISLEEELSEGKRVRIHFSEKEEEKSSIPSLYDAILVATGSHPEPISWIQSLGVSVISQVPSLFTFNCPSSPLLDLSGISVPHAKVSLNLPSHLKPKRSEKPSSIEGPLLLTHWGFSGPAILKLSAFYAVELHELDYKTSFTIDWAPNISHQDLKEAIQKARSESGKKLITNTPLVPLPKSLYERLLSTVSPQLGSHPWSQLSRSDEEALIAVLKKNTYEMSGKSTYKNEFVTAGGISLNEVDPKTMALKKFPNIYLSGEILNIDGITGGFNFQAAWTTATVAARGIKAYIEKKARSI